MRFPKVLLILALTTAALAADSPRAPLLPKQFGGWQISGTPQISTDPAVTDPTNPALLKEYGFTDFESATYARDDGRKLSIKAARFADATGAYGAFTFYRSEQMLAEKIGDQGASFNERVLFMRGNILIDAVFARLTAMSAAELRELAADLPLPAGNAGNLPNLPSYLPRPALKSNSIKYALGPIALEKLNSPVSGDLVDFNAGAEVVLGNYKSEGGDATLIVISYPTPQIATEHLRRLDAARAQGTIATLLHRRSGPIVAIASGPFSSSEAKSLLASINYDADVTWNENTHFTDRENLGKLLWNILILSAIIVGFTLVAGIAFGGLRILINRFLQQRGLRQESDMEFISLHLSQNGDQAADSKVSPSIKVG